MQLSLHSHKLYLISVESSLIPSATRSGVPSSCRSGCGSHYGTVISAAFGIIEGSSSCILTKALFVPDVCGTLCHVNLSLVSVLPCCFHSVGCCSVTIFF